MSILSVQRRRRSGSGPGARTTVIGEPDPEKKRFTDDDELLSVFLTMFQERMARPAASVLMHCSEDSVKKHEAQYQAWYAFAHRCLKGTRSGTPLCKRIHKLKLCEVEAEVLILHILHDLGISPGHIGSVSGAVEHLMHPGRPPLAPLRCFLENRSLVREGLLIPIDPEETLRERSYVVAPGIAEELLCDAEQLHDPWAVSSDLELNRRLRSVLIVFRERSTLLGQFGEIMPEHMRERMLRLNHRANLLQHRLGTTLASAPDLKFSKLMATVTEATKSAREHCSDEHMITAILAGRELGMFGSDEDLFQGIGLARAGAESNEDAWARLLTLFAEDAPLIAGGIVRPCGGFGAVLTSSANELAEVEFELSDRARQLLDLDRDFERAHRKSRFTPRAPRVGLDELALSEEVLAQLSRAEVQIRHADVLLGAWGLGRVIHYGRAVTMLFYGPPGTGKTATAEGLAHALDRPFLSVSYPEIMNSFVGMTEKNIARVFRAARDSGAVLFWDEVDSMLYDRDSARQGWEVRDINVLLQELEKFEGLCILATNRQPCLDKALERRIALKVPFERPSQDQRRQIWDVMIPEELPLASDVCLDSLAAEDLSGGEIKNVLLNAARGALLRGADTELRMDDLRQAIESEHKGRWSNGASKPFGFSSHNPKSALLLEQRGTAAENENDPGAPMKQAFRGR